MRSEDMYRWRSCEKEFHKTLLRLLPPVPLSQLLVHAVDAVRIDFADYREALVAAEDAERVVELLKSLGPASRNDTLPSKESVLLGRWSSSKTVETGRGVDVQVELRGALIRFLKESSVSRAAFSSGAVLLVGDAKSAARCGAAPPVGHTVSASSSSAALPAGDAMSASSSSAAPHALSATGSYSGYTDSFDVQSGSVERCNVCVDFQRGSACPRCNWSSGNTDSFDAQSGVEVEKAPVDPRTLAEAHRAVQESKPVPRLRMSRQATSCTGDSTGTCARHSEIAQRRPHVNQREDAMAEASWLQAKPPTRWKVCASCPRADDLGDGARRIGTPARSACLRRGVSRGATLVQI